MFKLGKPLTWNEETDEAMGDCCFCGKEIQHVNDGGVGYGLEAKDENGLLGEYLYCCHPMCQEAYDNEAADLHRCYNPAHTDTRLVAAGCMGEGWKLDIEPMKPYNTSNNYLKFLGDRCPECGGLVADVDARLHDPTWTEFFSKKEA
jgi:hypothetical protein